MRKKVIINARFLELPMVGTTRFAIEVCRELVRNQSLDLLFLSPAKIRHEEIAEEFGVKRVGSMGGHLWEQIELPIFLRKEKKTILLNFTNTAPLFFKNNVTSILDVIPLINPAWVSRKLYYINKFLLPLVARRSKQIITLSEHSKTDIIRKLKVPAEKVNVVYCGVTSLSRSKTSENNVESNDRYVLAVSSLEPRKNFINIVKAFNLLKDTSVKLILVGSNFQYLLHTLTEHINVERTIVKGYVPDDELQQLYSNAIAFVYPSLYEGFGLPPLEAMYYDCPVITSDVSSIPEVCGDAAIYADPHSPQEIADKIEELMNNEHLRYTLIERGRKKIKEFTWKRTADLTLEVINKVF